MNEETALTPLSNTEAAERPLLPTGTEPANAGPRSARGERAGKKQAASTKDASSKTAGSDGAEPPALAIARACLAEMKAEDVVEIDLVGRTSLADAMFIATGRVNRHVGAIADAMIEAFKANGVGPVRMEGQPACDWVLIDAGDVIIHVFRPEVRQFYNLEKMWGTDRPAERAANA